MTKPSPPQQQPVAVPFNYVTRDGLVTTTAEHTPKREGCIRIVAISDTHEQHESVAIPDGDILIHSGDLFFRCRAYSSKDEKKLAEINSFFGALPHKHKVVIAGNHDGIMEALGKDSVKKILSNVTYLENESIEIEGLRFYGAPISIGHTNNKAFQGRKFLMEALSKMPDTLDFLITHAPSHRVEGLKEAMQARDIKCHISGHFHAHYGLRFGRRTTYISAPIVDVDYEIANLPIVFDVTSPAAALAAQGER